MRCAQAGGPESADPPPAGVDALGGLPPPAVPWGRRAARRGEAGPGAGGEALAHRAGGRGGRATHRVRRGRSRCASDPQGQPRRRMRQTGRPRRGCRRRTHRRPSQRRRGPRRRPQKRRPWLPFRAGPARQRRPSPYPRRRAPVPTAAPAPSWGAPETRPVAIPGPKIPRPQPWRARPSTTDRACSTVG